MILRPPEDHRASRPRATARAIGLAPGASAEASGQDAKKYGTSNPVVRRLLDRWTGALQEVLGDGWTTVVDVGIGEGFALERIVPPDGSATKVTGVEYRPDKLAAAMARRDGLAGVVADAGMVPLRDGAADLVLCIEVLEHLVRVEPAVAELARICGKNGRCVVSVPWEPWFRLGNLGRGKNLGRLGDDPEHVQHFSRRSLEQILRTRFGQVRVRPCFPWLIGEASL